MCQFPHQRVIQQYILLPKLHDDPVYAANPQFWLPKGSSFVTHNIGVINSQVLEGLQAAAGATLRQCCYLFPFILMIILNHLHIWYHFVLFLS